MTGFDLLLRVHPRDNPRMMTVGDVVSVHPLGHGWGPDELAHPHWRIVRVMDLPPAVARSLTAEEVPDSFAAVGWVRRRGLTVDVRGLDVLTGGLLLADRAGGGPDVTVGYADFRGLVSLKAKLLTRRLIGPNRRVLG